jgi:hypothetical protein
MGKITRCKKTGDQPVTCNETPRLADFAIARNAMLIELLTLIYKRRFARRGMGGNVARTMGPMLVSMVVTEGTRCGTPYNITEISKRLEIPPTSVERYLRALLAHDIVSQQGFQYVTDLEHVDALLASASYVDGMIEVMEASLCECKRLREVLASQLRS